MDDDTYFDQFYAGTKIPRDIAVGVRAIYAYQFDIDILKLRPVDRPPDFIECDTIELVRHIEREFRLTMPDKDCEQLDGSIDSVVQYLAVRRQASRG